MKITEGDLDAIIALLCDLSDEAQELPFDTLLDRADHLIMVGDALKRAREQIETAKKTKLESGAIETRGKRYVLKRHGQMRYNHSEVARIAIARIREAHRDTTTGEMPDPGPLGELARVFTTLYLNNSAKPKMTAVQNLLDIPQGSHFDAGIATWDPQGTRIVDEEIE